MVKVSGRGIRSLTVAALTTVYIHDQTKVPLMIISLKTAFVVQQTMSSKDIRRDHDRPEMFD